RLQVDAHRVLVRCLDPLDLPEGERLYAFLRIGFVAVLDVRGHQLAPVEWRDVLPLDALTEPEGPDTEVRAALPRLREVALQREVGGIGCLVGERIANEAVVD